MTQEQKDFCIEAATSYFREGFSDWVNGKPKDEHQGESYYTGWNEAKKMHPECNKE